MELDDCCLPDAARTSSAPTIPNKAFTDCNWALLVGAFPRKQGMERKDLLGINGKIFVGQGKALAANAATDVRILVVGNPCNTNCLVAYNNGQRHPRRALDRHDAARPQPRPHRPGQEGRRRQRGRDQHDHLGQPQQHAVSRLHQRQDQGQAGHRRSSPTAHWLENTFVPQCQNRGAAVIKARGFSSAMSAANGALDHVKSLLKPTPANDWVSMAVVSKGEYGVPAGLVFGYPCRSDGKGNFSVVEGVKLDAFGQQKFRRRCKELQEERDAVKGMLGGS